MGWQPEQGSGAGGEPGPGFWLPGTPELAGFARGGVWDVCPPGPELAAVAALLSGPEWRCPGSTDDELAGLLRRWAALESWAAAARLGVVAEMIRRDGPDAVQRHGDLPDAWSESLTHELALALAESTTAADRTAWLAWELQARLPGTGALLAGGALTLAKARIVAEAFQYLGDDDAARAEALIASQLTGKTPAQTARLAARAAAASVDPDLARRRREAAEREDARVSLWREQSGAASLGGFNLPTDQALAAYANVNARTRAYKDSGAFPDAKTDQLRVMAYLDLLNDIPAASRIAGARAKSGAEAEAAQPEPGDRARDRDGGLRGEDGDGSCGDDGTSGDDGPSGPSGPGDGGQGGDGAGNGGPSGGGPGVDHPRGPRETPPQASLPPRVNLVIPLATLLGIGFRPGEGHGLGPLDPALCLDLAATAANSPRSEWCVTVTDADGIAIGHGCARPGLRDRKARPAPSGPPGAALPARVSLTIRLADLQRLAAGGGRDGPGPWAFTPLDDPGPPDGYGTWTLTLPDGRALTVRLEAVPTYGCDHRHESHGYQPNDKLRHLVQVRDGQCTLPVCSRHARDSDFEHATPYDKGGRTCACNAGARSRKCHRIKQSPGWNVTQPRPGWHTWQTPSGRVYTQGPFRYPA